MGKATPTPPPTIDPTALAAAQGESNVQSALASTILNQVNTVGPGGTTSFAQTGGQDVGGQFIPSFTQTTELTPEGQAQFEAQQQLGSTLTGLAQDQFGRVGEALGEGIDTSQLEALTGGVEAGPLQGQIPGAGQDIQGGLDVSGLRDVREDFGAQGRELEQATFQRGLGLLAPELARQQQDVELLATERGLPLGSESAQRIFAPFEERRSQALENLALSSVGAGRDEQARLFGQALTQRGQQFGEATTGGQFANQAQEQGFGQQLAGGQFANQAQNLAFNQEAANAAAANAARAQGFQEQAFLRSLPINDIAALLGTAPGLQQPQFQQTAAFGVQAPDVIGATLGAGNLAQQQFATQQAAAGGLLGGLLDLGGSLGSAAITASDIRLKSNIVPLGKTPGGFNLYSYIKDGMHEIGVMAQEVLKFFPEAVHEKDGYLAVNYRLVT